MATKIRKLIGWDDAALYVLRTGEHVIVSAVDCYSGPETLVFPATPEGDIADWLEIGGGRGYLDHERALADVEPDLGELVAVPERERH